MRMKGHITKITTQQKNHERYNVYIDKGHGEEYGFSVDQDVLIKFHLKKGKVIDDLELDDILFEDDVKKAFQKAINYLSYKMRSTKEVRVYLQQNEIDEPIIIEVLHKLADFRYINDEEYAFAYVRTQKNTTDKGPEIIKKELHEKGISPHLIEASIQQYSLNEQIETLAKSCEKLLNKHQLASDLQKRAKLEQFCLRKGFLLSTLELALKEISVEPDEDQQWEAFMHHAKKAQRKYQHLPEWEYRQKMKQAMYRKGFSLDLIDQYLNMEKDE